MEAGETKKSGQGEEENSIQNPKYPPTHTFSGLQILVVDDEADAYESIATVLEEYKARVTADATAAEALKAVEKLQPSVLVSDIGMPGENGYSRYS